MNTMEKRDTEGWSEAAWKSVAVKSLRLGWPAGLARAERALTASGMKPLLICGLFEDVFPPPRELPRALAEIARRDYEALCRRETHHGRGMTPQFCGLEYHAVRGARSEQGRLYREAKRYKLWLPPRSLNCFWTWLAMLPQPPQPQRTVDEAEWRGMLPVFLDGHTPEGRERRTLVTLLSGHYRQHDELGKRVLRDGWEEIRRQVHAEAPLPAPGPALGQPQQLSLI